MIIDYYDKLKSLEPMQAYLGGKKRKQFNKLVEWYAEELRRVERYKMDLADIGY